MATVPTYGGFNVMPNEGAAFGATQMATPSLPNTHQQLDRSFTRAGEHLERFIEKQDDARVTAALTELRRHAIDVETGENGYRSLMGENALKPDEDGRSLIERVDEEMQTFGSKLASELSPRQQKLFSEKAQVIYQASYGGVSQHVFDQGQIYQVNSIQASLDQQIESGAVYAGKPDELARAEAGIHEDILKLSELRGLSKEQTEVMRRKSVSGLYMNAILNVMTQADQTPAMAYQAQGILQANSEKMLASDVMRARKAINASLEVLDKSASIEGFLNQASTSSSTVVRDFEAVTGSSISQRGIDQATVAGFEYGILSEVSEGGHQSTATRMTDLDGKAVGTDEWRYGASQMAIPEATETAKKHGQILDEKRYVTDRAYNQAIGMARYGDLIKQYAGDQTQALAEWHATRQQVKDAKAEAQKKGTPEQWVKELPQSVQNKVARSEARIRKRTQVTGYDGKEINALSPEYAANAKKWPTVEEARAYFKRMNPRAAVNPEYLEQLVSGTAVRIAQQKASYEQQQANLVASIGETLWQNGGDVNAIPASLWSQLDINQQRAVRQSAHKMAIGDQSSDLQIKAKLMTNDDYLVSLSEDQVNSYRLCLSYEDGQNVLYRYHTLKEKQIASTDTAHESIRDAAVRKINPKFIPPASMVEKSLKAFAPGFKDWLDEEPETARMFQMAVMDALTFEGMKQSEKLGDQLMIDKTVQKAMKQMVPINGELKSLASLRYSELPDKGRTDVKLIIDRIAAYRLWDKDRIINRQPTDGEKQEVLTSLMMSRELPFVIPSGRLTEQEEKDMPTEQKELIKSFAVLFDSDLMKRVEHDWEEKYKTKMSNADKLRAYISLRLTGERINTDKSAFNNIYMPVEGFDE